MLAYIRLFPFFLFLFFLQAPIYSNGQAIGQEDETAFYAETKQVNQFFRRFNNEEGPDGNKYDEADKRYRSPNDRIRYMAMLFDLSNKGITDDLKRDFVTDVVKGSKQKFLDFHGGKWFSEVKAKFIYQGKEENVILYFKLQEEKVGSKWVISKVYFKPFDKILNSDTTGKQPFLHPLSHELDFMNLNKILQESEKNKIDLYAAKEHKPDHLTLFLYEVKKSNLKFKTVSEVKFHFFQLDNWYFELAEFNREDKNKGWLISNLVKVSEKDKSVLLKHIYNE